MRSTALINILGYGERREHRSVADIELLENVMEMDLDGTIGNVQPPSNFLVRQSLGHQAHDLPLAICQYCQRFLCDCSLPPECGLIG